MAHGSEHLLADRLPQSARWQEVRELTAELRGGGWRETLAAFGYEIAPLPQRGYLASAGGKASLTVHPHRSADAFARLDEAGRLPEGALIADCLERGAPCGCSPPGHGCA